MKLQEVFDQLSAGEFSQLSIGGANAGVIDESNYARVVGHVNLGLTALFKRFMLKEGRAVLQLQPNQTLYTINSAYAVNARRSIQPVRYLLDTPSEPFVDDVLKIEQVLTTADYELGLNDNLDPYSTFTPSMLSLRVPEVMVDGSVDIPDELKTSTLTLVYRANHPKIVVGLGYFDPNRVELQLPDSHLEALLLYVAARAQTPMGMGPAESQVANVFSARYEQACKALEGQGLEIDPHSQGDRLSRNGWV